MFLVCQLFLPLKTFQFDQFVMEASKPKGLYILILYTKIELQLYGVKRCQQCASEYSNMFLLLMYRIIFFRLGKTWN